ncbi:MAG: MarR family transcriptional regulator [Peptostreptococcaceae bacterium]
MKKQILLGQLLETVDSLKGDRKHKKREEKRKNHCDERRLKREEMIDNGLDFNQKMIAKEEMKKKRMEMKENMTGEEKVQRRNHKMSSATKNILCYLLTNEDINQQTLAKIMNISPQATSEIIKRLEGKGLILKTSGEYKNENIINLTEEGREVADHVDKKIKEDAKNIFKDFTEEELDLLSKLIEKLNIPKKNKESDKER